MRVFYFLIFLLCATLLSGKTPVACAPSDRYTPAGTDLCLIYCARPSPMVEYTRETMKKYLIYEDDKGKSQFLFDGFVIFDIRGAANQPLENNPDAVSMEHWSRLLDRYFQPGWAISAIDEALEDLKNQKTVPRRKRKIYIGIPVPYAHTREFGEVYGTRLTMDNVENRTKAAKWFVDEALRRWKAANFRHLDLAGFYWVEEHARDQGDQIIPEVAEYVHTQGYPLVWIPYFGSQNAYAKDWKKLGFDRAFYQPNYFFVSATRAGVPPSRIDDAVKFAATHGMSMEFEFDHNVKDTLYQRKFEEYIRGFTHNRVFSDVPVAYYEGGGAWALMATSNDAEVQKLYRKLAEIIVARQRKYTKINKYK